MQGMQIVDTSSREQGALRFHLPGYIVSEETGVGKRGYRYHLSYLSAVCALSIV